MIVLLVVHLVTSSSRRDVMSVFFLAILAHLPRAALLAWSAHTSTQTHQHAYLLVPLLHIWILQLLLVWLAKLHVYHAKAAHTAFPALQDFISTADHASHHVQLRLTQTPR